ncbi:MAG: IS3 family transposase [Acidiferrobacterales bacterium]
MSPTLSGSGRSRAEARSAIFAWIEVFYNREHLHETLGYVSPVRYEAATYCCLTTCPWKWVHLSPI